MSTWVGRYAIVGGQVREHGPWLVDRLRQREDESLRLLVLTEPVDERSADFCNEVAEAVAALFSRESLSVTGGLLRALRQAHTNLAEWNRRSLREHHVAVGITCVAVRDGEVTIAQAGPGVVYVHGAGGITRLSTEGLPSASPLGGREQIEPSFASASLRDREVLLLTSAAEAAIGREDVEASLALGAERSLAELFRRTHGVRDMSAVLVADLELDEEQAAAPLDDWSPVDDEPEGREVILAAGDVDRPPPPRPSPLPRIRRPPRSVGRRDQQPAVPWRVAAIAVAIAAALAVAAWAILPGLLSEDRAAQLEAALAAAEAQVSAADTAGRVEDERAALRAALRDIERARGIEPSDPRIAQMDAAIQARLALLDAVTAVGALTPVLSFEGTITAPVNPEELVYGGRALWLRESGRGRVFRVDPISGEAVEVYRAGETYDGVAARDPLALAWDAATARMLVLDAGRTLFAVADDPGGAPPEHLPLRDAADIRSAVAMAAYLGNLYILDPQAGEVWRYLPTASGFDSERSGIVGGADMPAAAALAVDGDVFVLDGSTLRRFRQGNELSPLLEGIDQPPQSPVGLVEDVLRGLLYLADRGHRRIIVTDRGGPFVRQYRHADFIDLRGLAVAADGSRIFVLSGSGIASFEPVAR